MQTTLSNPFVPCKLVYRKLEKTLIVLISFLLSANSSIFAQTTCATATAVTAVNGSSCTPGTTFNISGTGTGPIFLICATGGTVSNNWGRFVANSSTASISYTPAANRNAMIFTYTGACGLPVQSNCANSGGNGVTETVNLTGLTAGTTYYFRIARYGSTGNMNGNICVASPFSIVTGTISGSPFCAGASVSVPFTSYGTYSGNTYTAQLSDASGSFSSPTNIGTLTSNANSGTISATLPYTASGIGYRIRVVSNGPSVTGADNGLNIIINPAPTITSSTTASDKCFSTSAQTSTLSYSATTNSPINYTITWNAAALAAGFTNVGSTALPASPINFAIAANTAANTYTGTLNVSNLLGCSGPGYSFTQQVVALPTITASSSAAARCYNASAQSSFLTYSASTGSPTQYSITWNGAALAAGLVNVSNDAITASPLNIPVAAGVISGTYNGTLTVTNAAGCVSTGSAFSLNILTTPTITAASSATSKCYSASSQTSSISYSATTGTPTQYAITWDPTAISAGFVNLGLTAITSSPLNIPVAAGVAAGTYNGTLTVRNASGCSSTGSAFTITINPLPSITGTLTTCIAATTQLTGSGTPDPSSPWLSATTSVATVNSTGLVTGVSAGTSVITYTNNNGCSQTATVTVNAQPGALTMAPSSASVCPGSIQSLSVSNYVNNSPQTSSSGAISVSIPDNSSTGASSTISVSGIPTDATVTGVSVNFNITHTYDGDLILNIKAPNGNILNLVNRRGGSGDNFTNTSISSSSSTAVSSGSAPFSSTYAADAASGVGPTSNVSNVTAFSSLYGTPNGNWILSARDNANSDVGTITSWSVIITYTLPAITWATNTTDLYTDAAATIPYVSQTASTVYTKPNSNQTYTATATNANGCTNSNSVSVTMVSLPTITASATAATVCFSSTSQNSTLAYSAVTGSPTQYSITWDAAALAAGLVNLGNTAITASPLNIPIAANVAAGTYTGSAAVTNGTCSSSGSTFTVTINPLPTITSSASATAKCFSSSYQNGTLAFSATSNSPTNYSIVWDAAALSAGLTNVTNATLSGSPLFFPIPAGTAAATYNGTLTVSNSNGCVSTGNAFTQLVAALPTITSASSANTICYSSSSQNSYLSYSATSGSPTLYSITWNAAALAAGLVNVSFAALPSSPVTIPVAAGVAAGTYNGTISVMNGAGCQSPAANAFTLTISSSSGPVMTSASSASICSGGTVNIPLTSSMPSTYTWIAASNANVSGESTTQQTTSTLNNTLTITSGGTQTVNYTVTPTAISGCQGTAQTVTVTVNAIPTITSSAAAAQRCYNTSGQTSTLSFSATTNSPTTYNIVWNAAALAAGLVNTGNQALPSSPITFSIPAGVAAGTYTGTLTVATAAGCTSSGNSFTVTIAAGPSITTQPLSQSVCAGSSTTFSVVATGTSLTYQWRKGTTNLCNCGDYSGVATATLTVNPVAAGDAATNYNCVVSSSGCSSVISDYATLTVTASASAPTALPKDLVFPTVGTTSVLGSFTQSSDATNYLVIRKTTNVAPTNPSDGTTYALNSTTLTGTVDYVGTSTSFTSNGLTPGTTYYYWVFPYNTSACGTSPLYLTSTPLTGSVTTATNVACGTVTTLYWGGTGSGLTGAVSGTDFNTASNWSTSSTTYIASPAAPTQCNNVSLAMTNNAAITLSGTTDVYGLTFTVSGNNRVTSLSTNGNTLTVNSDAVIDVLSGNTNTNIYIGEMGAGSGIVDFKGNFKIGETYYSGGSVPKSYVVGNINSKITFRGDVLFGRTARFTLPGGVSYPPAMPTAVPGAGTTPGTIEFDGPGLQQVLWNNDVWYDCFYNIVIGNQNKPYVRHVTGTYTPDNILNNFTINDGCTVDLGTSQWIREASGGTFTMNGNAKLILGNNQSIQSNCGGGCHTGVTIPGSNFPGGFATLNISANSTIEYNAGSTLTQTVYATPTYGNLILSNANGTGNSSKISTGVVNISGTATISDKTTFTPGADITVTGSMNVNSGGTLVCGTRTVSGTGTFSLLSGGTITMASTAGITSYGASGNIQTDNRSFSTGGNYTYNASSAQAIGNGMPNTVNNLTISNSAGVSMYASSSNYTVAGTLALTTGALNLNGDSLTINNLTRVSGTLTGSATSSVGVTGTNIPLFFTSGGRVLKNLFLNTNASADLQTTLDITAGSSPGSVSVGSGATLTTYSFLTLKSDANGTARVAEIPVDGSGNALGTISGDVVVERFIPAKRSWRMVTAPLSATGDQTINEAWQEGVVNADITNNQNPTPGFGVHISGSSPTLGFDATPLNNPSLKVFDRATSSWSGIANTLNTYIKDYEGYMLFVRGNRSTPLSMNTGAPLSTTVIRANGGLRMGRQSVSLGSGAGSYTLVGNPYPSTIDFRSLSITGLGSTKTFVLWDPALTGTQGVGAYQYFTQVGGAGTDYTVFPGGGSYGASGTVNNFVQSGQAFLVQNTGAATLVINENSKASSSTSTVFRPMPDNTTGKISTILYRMGADSSMMVVDGGLVLYRSEYDDNLDLDDVKKINNTNSENFGINKNSVIYQIEKRQSINEEDSIQYSMRNLVARPYHLEINLTNMEATGMQAYLKDNYTNTLTRLEYGTATIYPFTPTAVAAGSYAADRFKIVFKPMTVLPVSFTTVDAHSKKNGINVVWETANEANTRQYVVEKSADGRNFTKLSGNIPAGNSKYEWLDEQPLQGVNYYRVKSIENNGRSQYSNIVKAMYGKQAATITVFPNPVADGNITLYFNQQQNGSYFVKLFNTAGQLVQTEKLQSTGNGNTTIAMGNNLPHGNYILEVTRPDSSKEHINIVF